MRVTFVLPCHAWKPVGGFKVVYEYANRLASRGHVVTVVQPWFTAPVHTFRSSVDTYLRRYMTPLLSAWRGSWFTVDPRVRLLSVPDLRSQFIPESDFVFATGWQTAEQIASYPPAKGQKLYLVMDYETWMTATEEIRRRMTATFQAKFGMIAISSVVVEMLNAVGVTPLGCIFVGTDFCKFRIDTPVQQRKWGTIGFPVRSAGLKGTADAIKAVNILRRQYGESLDVRAFGAELLPSLPRWISYSRFPADDRLAEFFNQLAIFVLPSHHEGWGLPGIEALACGVALVTSDSGGVRDYAMDGETALVVRRAQPELLAAAVARLLGDDNLRRRLALRGHKYVQQYGWPSAVDALESVMFGLNGHDSALTK